MSNRQISRTNRSGDGISSSPPNASDTTYYNKKNAPKELNSNNVFISRKFLIKLFRKFGLTEIEPNNMEYYQCAFVHKSYIKSDSSDEEEIEETENLDLSTSSNSSNKIDAEVVPFQEESYERLEYMGDAVLNKVAAHYLFHRYPNQQEGFLTTLRTKLVRSETLCRLAIKMKLQKYLLISKYVEEKCNGRKNPKILEDLFESLIGAMYLDFGPENGKGDIYCMKFIIKIFETFIDITRMIRVEDNYKKVLLEYYQPRFRTEPKYKIISMRGPTSNREYTMAALSPTGEIVGIGTDKKKREAENIASKQALIYYGVDIDGSESESSSSEESSSSSESSYEE